MKILPDGTIAGAFDHGTGHVMLRPEDIEPYTDAGILNNWRSEMYLSTKTYGHEIGLSTCFRQHRAESHCRLLHGYALSFKFIFETFELDCRQWTVDFGGLKSLKGILEDTFDHTLLVAEDDPKKEVLLDLDRVHGIAKVVVVPAAGCERTAQLAFEVAEQWLKDAGYGDRVRLRSVEVAEHGANSAIYENPNIVAQRMVAHAQSSQSHRANNAHANTPVTLKMWAGACGLTVDEFMEVLTNAKR